MPPFPMNVVDVLKEELLTIDGISVDRTFGRPLRPSDPHMSIGIFPHDWAPLEDTMEIGGMGVPAEPVLSRYGVGIQTFVKSTDEEEGIAAHALMSKLVRSMLYRGTDIRVRLPGLVETTFGMTERLHRWGVTQQRFLSNEVEGSFVFLSSLDIWFETETVPAA